MTQSRKSSLLPIYKEREADVQAVSGRFPPWLHRRLPLANQLQITRDLLTDNRMVTVCEEAKCPNLFECWSKKTATFLIMGRECTRNCGFCSIDFSKTPQPLESDEPQRVASAVRSLGLKHVVITMVARDDLTDGGSTHLIEVMQEVRKISPSLTIEVLTSDFAGNKQSWEAVLTACPDIFNHNIETVRELSGRVRHKASYERTLELLNYACTHKKKSAMKVKSGLMVGLGETKEQVYTTLQDLQEAGCDIVTIGQYLQPVRQKLRVKSFVAPDTFKKYESFGRSIGISCVYAGPFVRSSYNAAEIFKESHG